MPLPPSSSWGARPFLPAAQDSVEQFYRGKTVNIVVGSAVGGGFDGYARMVARHLGKYIPGNPVVVVQNLPGAGSNKAASFVALQAPKDGTAIGAIQPGAVLQPLVSDQPVPHDPSKFIMLGSGSYSVYLCMLRADAPAKSFQEVLTKEVIIGTSGEGSTLREMPIMLINVLGAKFRLVSGYAGSREVLIAIERNEVHGICGMGWSSIAMQQREWIRNGTLRIIAQEDLKGHPEVNKMGVPLTISFAKTEEDRQVMEMMYSQSLFGRPYVLPPEVPADRGSRRCARPSWPPCRTRSCWPKPRSPGSTSARCRVKTCKPWWPSCTHCRRR